MTNTNTTPPPDALRFQILRVIQNAHAEHGTFVEDTHIASTLDVPLTQVQDQLEILESHKLVDLVKTFGPTFGAQLTPGGREALEADLRPDNPTPSRIGF